MNEPQVTFATPEAVPDTDCQETSPAADARPNSDPAAADTECDDVDAYSSGGAEVAAAEVSTPTGPTGLALWRPGTENDDEDQDQLDEQDGVEPADAAEACDPGEGDGPRHGPGECQPGADDLAADDDAGPAAILGRYYCGEVQIGASQIIDVGAWRVSFSARDRPEACHIQCPEPGEVVQRKRRPDDASRHMEAYLGPKSWSSLLHRGWTQLERGELHEGDHGIIRLGRLEILSEQASCSQNGNGELSEFWRWQATFKSTPAWVDLLLARGKHSLAFFLVQMEMREEAPQPRPAAAPTEQPAAGDAQLDLFVAPSSAQEQPGPDDQVGGPLLLGAPVVEAELVEASPEQLRATYAEAVADYLRGQGQNEHKMPFGWVLRAVERRMNGDVSTELVIDALLERPETFICAAAAGSPRSIQNVQLAGLQATEDADDDDDGNRPGSWHLGPEAEAEMLRRHLMGRGGRDAVAHVRIYGTGAMRTWTDARILQIAHDRPELFREVRTGQLELRTPSGVDLEQIVRGIFTEGDASSGFVRRDVVRTTGEVVDGLSRALKVSKPQAHAWFKRIKAAEFVPQVIKPSTRLNHGWEEVVYAD